MVNSTRCSRGTGAGGVALVENEVQHTQDRRHSCGAFIWRGHAELATTGLDALLGATDPLAHSWFWHEKRSSDFCRGQPADGAQRQRDL